MKRLLIVPAVVFGLALDAAAVTAPAVLPMPLVPPPDLQVAAPSVPSAAGSAAPGFLPPRQKIEKPYTDDKCLKNCHELPGFTAGDVSGVRRSLYVDPGRHLISIHAQKGLECVDCHQDSDPNFHPRTGYARVDCRACHSANPSEGAYPPKALERLKAKGIKPPPKESLKGEGWVKTVHAKAWMENNPAAPSCSGCHTAHYQLPAKDPRSSVNRENLPKTCGSCHVDQVRSYDVGGALARFRISGHGKGDLSTRYEVTECLSCHAGEGAHGEETIRKQACPRCHRVPPKSERETTTFLLSSLHARPLAPDQPVAEALRWVYTLLIWGAVAGIGLFVLFMGFSTLYRAKDDSGDGN